MRLAFTNADKAAIGLSVVCAAHCLLFPVALVFLPAVAATAFGDDRFHQWMLLVVLPISVLALTVGFRRHRKTSVLAIGLPGLAILTLAALVGHDWFGETGEAAASVLGASLIALSHLRNHALCQRFQVG
ncbi:MAG: MerC domain-containing protein [Pseudomonadota bacterium]|nr:MerC domain-containing protein [Pseudomonadota bacterium]